MFVAPADFDGAPCGTNNNYRVNIMCEPCQISPCGPDAGSCIESNGSPGCEDVECCELVCSQDPFCCETTWDSSCAAQAIELCLGCGPDAGNCATPNGTPGCEDTECCLAVCANDPFCCDVEWDQACANQAIDICTCTPDAGSCYLPNGTPGCEINECCTLVCAEDPFCCATEWDTLCVSRAVELCGDPACNSAAGPCNMPNGTPGCDDPACCNLVCDQDPFCCDTEWDQICADAAAEACP